MSAGSGDSKNGFVRVPQYSILTGSMYTVCDSPLSWNAAWPSHVISIPQASFTGGPNRRRLFPAEHCSRHRGGHEPRVSLKIAARSRLRSRSRPPRLALCEFAITHLEREPASRDIDVDGIAFVHQC
jgi:hypothetical protein